MTVDLYTKGFQFLLVSHCRGLLRKLCEHHGSNKQAVITKSIYKTQHIHIVGDAQIAAHLVLLDIGSVDGDDYLRIILHGA